jgi:hypothetical protein
MPQFRKGAESAEESHEAAKSGGRAQYLSITENAKQPTFIRLLSGLDEWIDCEVHMGVPTKAAPKDYSGNWPQNMSAVCQNDAMFREMLSTDRPNRPTGDYEPGYGHCYIHEHMAEVMGKFGRPVSKTSPTVWALCIIREPVRGPSDSGRSGKIIGFQDKMEDWADDSGTKHNIPAIRIVSQRYGNFFGAIKQSAYIDEEVRHRDFMIERDGNDYEITPLTPTPDHAPGTASWKLYTDALALTGISLEETIVRQSSPEYYARFFDPTKTAPPQDGDRAAASNGKQQEAPADTEAPAEAVNDDELADFKARIDKSMGNLGAGKS